MSRLLLVVVVAVAWLVAAPATQATVVAGAQEDEAGGSENPQQDLRTVAVVYDDATGTLRGALAFAEPPTGAGVAGASAGVGRWSKRNGACVAEADVSLFTPDEELPEWFGGLYIGDQEGPDAFIQPEGATIRFDVAWDQAASKGWNCGRADTFGPALDPATDDYEEQDETAVFSLTSQEAQQPAAPPECSLPTRVRRGRKLRVTCSNVTGRLTLRLYRKGRLAKARKLKVGRGGRGAVSTKRLRRGWYGARVWRGTDVLGYGELKIR